MKKFLSFILVLAMVLSVSSVALAEAVTLTDNGTAENPYSVSTEQELRAAIDKGGDIVLGDDIELSDTLKIAANKSVTLDLNGNTLSQTKDCSKSYWMIENSGSFTVKDSGNGGKISFTDSGNGDPNFGWGTHTVKNFGTMIVDGGTIENMTRAISHMFSAIDNSSNGVNAYFTMNGGVISCPNYCAIRQHANSENHQNVITINSGTISANNSAIFVHDTNAKNNKATLNIKGGTVQGGNRAIYVWDASATKTAEGLGINIEGGVFTGIIQFKIAEDSVLEKIISGGTFSAEPAAALIADGKVAAKSGDKWVVADKVNVSFNANGGAGTMASQTFAKGVAQALTANAFTRSGYTFTGWNTNANGEGTAYADKAEVTFNAVTTLYAQWKKEFTVENFTPVTPPTSSDPSDESEVTVTIQDVTVEMEEEEVDEILESVLDTGESAENTAIYLDVKEVPANDPEVVENQKVIDQKFGEDEAIIAYLDINLFKQVGNDEPKKVEELKNNNKIAITIELSEVVEGYTYYIIRVHNDVAERLNGTLDGNKFTFYTDRFSTYALASEKTPVSSGNGISVKYNGGNSFSTSNPAVPTAVEIDGVPVTFNGTGSNFTVGCINPGSKWVTVKWQSTTVTVNFKPDVTVECTTVGIPKTGDMPIWAAVAAFFGF